MRTSDGSGGMAGAAVAVIIFGFCWSVYNCLFIFVGYKLFKNHSLKATILITLPIMVVGSSLLVITVNKYYENAAAVNAEESIKRAQLSIKEQTIDFKVFWPTNISNGYEPLAYATIQGYKGENGEADTTYYVSKVYTTRFHHSNPEVFASIELHQFKATDLYNPPTNCGPVSGFKGGKTVTCTAVGKNQDGDSIYSSSINNYGAFTLYTKLGSTVITTTHMGIKDFPTKDELIALLMSMKEVQPKTISNPLK